MEGVADPGDNSPYCHHSNGRGFYTVAGETEEEMSELGNPCYDQNQMDEAMAEERERTLKKVIGWLKEWEHDLDCEIEDKYHLSHRAVESCGCALDFVRLMLKRERKYVKDSAKPRER